MTKESGRSGASGKTRGKAFAIIRGHKRNNFRGLENRIHSEKRLFTDDIFFSAAVHSDIAAIRGAARGLSSNLGQGGGAWRLVAIAGARQNFVRLGGVIW